MPSSPVQPAALGIAGLDQNLRLNVVQDLVKTTGYAQFGIAGVNCHSLADTVSELVPDVAQCGSAGELPHRLRTDPALFGIAGNLTPQTRQAIQHEAQQAQRHAARACLFPDHLFVVTKSGDLRFRAGRQRAYAADHRYLPVVLDSAAYRAWSTSEKLKQGKKPADPVIEGRHRTPDRYMAAIDLIDPGPVGNIAPLGAMAYDYLDDPDGRRTLDMYQAFVAAGYPVIPIFPVRSAGYNPALTPEQNARRHAQHPHLRYYTAQSRLVALGGLVRGPIPRNLRGRYIHELCRLFPAHYWWGLGQANYMVINYLNEHGLLDRVFSDGTWWISDAVCHRIPVVERGRLRMIKLGRECQSFFTTTERMLANLRSLLAAYAGELELPREPTPKPRDGQDPAAIEQLALGFQAETVYQAVECQPLVDMDEEVNDEAE
ncbi:MAG: hypothetical protein KJ734_10005 [Chloroflexi bacterium]|nr:hypothetical protein [Chloroflexota bacterium]